MLIKCAGQKQHNYEGKMPGKVFDSKFQEKQC